MLTSYIWLPSKAKGTVARTLTVLVGVYGTGMEGISCQSCQTSFSFIELEDLCFVYTPWMAPFCGYASSKHIE